MMLHYNSLEQDIKYGLAVEDIGQCRLAYFGHAATWGLGRLTSVMVGGAWWRVPWSPDFLTR